jgi:hypothetical protein
MCTVHVCARVCTCVWTFKAQILGWLRNHCSEHLFLTPSGSHMPISSQEAVANPERGILRGKWASGSIHAETRRVVTLCQTWPAAFGSRKLECFILSEKWKKAAHVSETQGPAGAAAVRCWGRAGHGQSCLEIHSTCGVLLSHGKANWKVTHKFG